MFRVSFTRYVLHHTRLPWCRTRPLTPLQPKLFNPPGTRTYRVINPQRVLLTWNALRIWIRNPMFRYQVAGMGLFCGVFYLYYSERVPVFGRRRFNIVSTHWERQLGNVWFQREIEQNSDAILPESSEQHLMVQRVLKRLITPKDMMNEPWEVRVVDDSELSAFVLPGGKVFVNRGLVDFCARDDELAVVLGHEIAHNVVRHASERLSRWLILIPVVMIGSLASGIQEDLVQLGIDVAFRLPHSRAHENEADYLGLLTMAESGYDPSAAMDLWTRWEATGPDPAPSFLCTHPSNHNRLLQFRDWLAQAHTKRLSYASQASQFSEAYNLQRTFCGIERHFTSEDTEIV